MKRFILQRQFLHHYVKKNKNYKHDSGFTLVELIVGALFGSVLIMAALGGFNSLRQLLTEDQTKVNVSQRLRSAFGSIGPDIQQTGEGLVSDPTFPVITVADSTTNPGTSVLTISKADLVGFLTICQDLGAGSSDNPIVINQADTDCQASYTSVTNGWPEDILEWQGKRLETEEEEIRAFIFDSSTGDGEFFEFDEELTFDAAGDPVTPENDDPTTLAIDPVRPVTVELKRTTTDPWNFDYNTGTTVIYLLEQRIYEVTTDNTLQLTVNDFDQLDEPLTFDLMEAIDDLTVTTTIQDFTVNPPTTHECTIIPPIAATSCDPNYNDFNDYRWSQIRSIQVTVTSGLPDNTPEKIVDRFDDEKLQLTQEFFPSL